MSAIKDKYQSSLQTAFPAQVFTEGTAGSLNRLNMHETQHGIDSVTDSGGVARFVVTGGPTLHVGQEITISGYTGDNLPYNKTGIISTLVAGDFEINEIAWIGTEASGKFDALVNRVDKLELDDAYKNLHEDIVGFAEDALAPASVDEVQTTDATTTTVATLPLDDEETYLINVILIGISDDNSDRAVYEMSGAYYRTGGGNATIIGANTVVSKRTDASWGVPVLTASGSDVLAEANGKASTTINWRAVSTLQDF